MPSRRSFKDYLRGTLTLEELNCLRSSLEIIGDIAILKLPEALTGKQSVIAEAIMSWNRHIKVVLKQTSPVRGEFRLRGLSWVAGERRTETVHREHGCQFMIDLTKAYFSPRLQFERKRVAELVKPGETVLNMFAGVGCFSILIAKLAKPAKVYSIDLNPTAIEYLNQNIRLNKVEDVVIPILGDAKEIVSQHVIGPADRVLLPLPEKAYEYLDVALSALSGGRGTLHYYDFVKTCDSHSYPKPLIEAVISKLRGLGGTPLLEGWRTVRSVGPGWYQVALDIKCCKSQGLSVRHRG
ncbi:MAG: class I SAM-dependent methyltransferase family protein [Candidatus Bathyarchaeia archaeon]